MPYDVGDRSQLNLDEVVVSLPVRGEAKPYQNLHIDLAATINPAKTTLQTSLDVSDILQRLQARIDSRLVEVFGDLAMTTQQSTTDMSGLRTRAVAEAQKVVDEAMKQWKYGADYEVKILVVSLYWTDGSVGRARREPRPIWW